MDYIFKSERLGFRPWQQSDYPILYKLCSDPKVMEYFPSLLDNVQSQQFLDRLIAHQQKHGFCYFHVEILETGEGIGFIGLAYQDFESEFTPCIDVGWRLLPWAWGKGYATEGAKASLNWGIENFGLEEIMSFAPQVNKASIAVMEKIGMELAGTFKHPKLGDYPELEDCVAYRIKT